ncbi:AraC family transcriptional regulator [Chryseobacterium piperi]|uniref:helix-turn-helix domain-containing protein n=1 Tax=Chryseobacterium piperi TaxID=558152 RepID=UPI00068AEDF8|nr:AraC family transcriptional regulator [Chryseobacterium piperi]ASW73855.1 AraC family transcriptional regulator [Chryseobacterium piperi]
MIYSDESNGLNNPLQANQFQVFDLKSYLEDPVPCDIRFFYKICIVHPESYLYYGDEWIHIDKTALLFTNPIVPYQWEMVSKEQTGYFCRFTNEFLGGNKRLQNSPLFRLGAEPVFFLNDNQIPFILDLFERMLYESDNKESTDYNVLRSYVDIIMHEAQKLQSDTTTQTTKASSEKVVSIFIEHLGNQFPVTVDHPLLFRKPSDFATLLSVHVNYLNYAVKELTGKTTTEHIHEKLISEAKIMIKNTDMNISEVAFSLGFEYSNNFSKFFKSHTNQSPFKFKQNNI